MEETDNCDDNGICTNTEGSFTCLCEPGFSGDGVQCEGNCDFEVLYRSTCCVTCDSEILLNLYAFVSTIHIQKGVHSITQNHFPPFTKTTFRKCCALYIHPSDIDECEENTDDCHINATCNNHDGGFSCECMTGLSGDGTTCSGMRLILKV